MALPKLNNFPKYEVTIPSTQKKVKFRPFLVKEQKVLLMALESQDQKQILGAIVDTIKSCAEEEISTTKLTSFDIEYLFVKIRSKSVGEKSNININCQSCEKPNTVNIDLDQIDIKDQNTSNKIVLSEQYTIQLKYPTYLDILNSDIKVSSVTEQLYSSIVLAMDKLHTPDELIDLKDESWEEKERFIDNLSPEQFQLIVEFITKAPSLKYNLKYKCTECGHENVQLLSGIQDFF